MNNSISVKVDKNLDQASSVIESASALIQMLLKPQNLQELILQ